MSKNKGVLSRRVVASAKGKLVVLLFCFLAVVSIFATLTVSSQIDKKEAQAANSRAITLWNADQLQIGDYVDNFGRDGYGNLRWRVVAKDSNGVMLRTERLLSTSNGAADQREFAQAKSGYINDSVQQTSTTSYVTNRRTIDGSNYYQQSNAKSFLDSYSFGFNTTQASAVARVPVFVPLPLLEVFASGGTTDIRQSSSVNWITTPTNSRYDVRIHSSTSVSNKISGGGSSSYVYNQNNAANQIRNMYTGMGLNYTPTTANSGAFLTPTTIVNDIDSQGYRNPRGERYQKALAGNNNAYLSASPLPASANISGTINNAIFMETVGIGIVAYDSNGTVNTYNYRAADKFGYQPSIYIKNTTVLTRTNNGNPITISGENVGSRYQYEISSSSIQNPNITTENNHTFEYAASGTRSITIETNTNDNVEWTIGTNTLPSSWSFNTNNRVLSGPSNTTPGTYSITLNAKNNYNGGTSTSKTLTISITKGNQPAASHRDLTFDAGNRGSADVIWELDANWRYTGPTISNYEAAASGTPKTYQAPIAYNTNSAIYNDYNTTITITVRNKTTQPAPDPLPSIDLPIGNNGSADFAAHLPANWRYTGPNLSGSQFVAEYQAEIDGFVFNTDTTKYNDLQAKLWVTVASKTQQQLPNTLPIINLSAQNQGMSEVVTKLPSGWKYLGGDNTDFFAPDDENEKDYSIPDFIYNSNELYYTDSQKTALTIRVGKKLTYTPSEVGEIPTITLNADNQGTAEAAFSTLPKDWQYIGGNFDSFVFNNTVTLSSSLKYNASPNTHNDYIADLIVTVKDKEQHPEPNKPSALDLPIRNAGTTDAKFLEFVQNLGPNWRYQGNTISQFAVGSTTELSGFAYNTNPNAYYDHTTTTVTIRVAQKTEQPQPNTLPPLNAKVGQTMSSMNTQLPPGYRWADGSANFRPSTMAPTQVELKYLDPTDSDIYYETSVMVTINAERGDAVIPPDSNTPGINQITANYNDKVSSIQGKLTQRYPGWFIQDKELEKIFDSVTPINANGAPTQDGHIIYIYYTPDGDNYEYHLSSMAVWVLAIDATFDPSWNLEFSGKVNDNLASVSNSDGKTLTQMGITGLEWQSDPTQVLEFAGEVQYLVAYKPNSNYSQTTRAVTVTIARINLEDSNETLPTEQDYPQVDAYVGLALQAANSQLQTEYKGWKFAEQVDLSQILENEETLEYDGVYNPNEQKYNDYLGVKIIVLVTDSRPTHLYPFGEQDIINAIKASKIRIGYTLGSLVDLIEEYYRADGLWFGIQTDSGIVDNEEAEFEVAGNTTIILLYNTNPNQFANYTKEFQIEVARKEAKQESELDTTTLTDLKLDKGKALNTINLPENFSFENPSRVYNTLGNFEIKILYNENEALWETTEITINIEIVEPQVPSQDKPFPLGAIIGIAAGAVVILGVVLFIIIRNKKQSAMVNSRTHQMSNRPAPTNRPPMTNNQSIQPNPNMSNSRPPMPNTRPPMGNTPTNQSPLANNPANKPPMTNNPVNRPNPTNPNNPNKK